MFEIVIVDFGGKFICDIDVLFIFKMFKLVEVKGNYEIVKWLCSMIG